MGILASHIYGFPRNRAKNLKRVATALQKRLGLTLERRNNSYVGDYYCWGGEREDQPSLRLYENDYIGTDESYIWWRPGHSPIVEVICDSQAEHDDFYRKIMTIPGVEFAWRYGDRRREFGSEDRKDKVSFIVDVSDRESSRSIRSIRVRGVPYCALMRTMKIPKERELMGAQSVTAKQLDALKAGLLPSEFKGSAFMYDVNLNSIKFDKKPAKRANP